LLLQDLIPACSISHLDDRLTQVIPEGDAHHAASNARPALSQRKPPD